MPELQEKDVFDFTNPDAPVVEENKDEQPKDDEKPQDDQPKDQDKLEDKPSDDKDQQPEEFEDEEQYVAQWREQGLPDDVKTLDDAMDFAVNAHNKAKTGEQGTREVEQINNWLSSQGIPGGINALMNSNANPSQIRSQQQVQPNNPQQFQPITNDSPILQAVMLNHQRGAIGDEQLPVYKGFASMADEGIRSGIQPKLDQQLGYIQQLTGVVQSLSKQVNDNNWRMQPKKIRENFNRQELDSAINGGMAGDYSSAAIYIAQNKNPALLQTLFGGQTSDDKPQRKKLRIGGQKPRKHERQVDVMDKYSKYMNSDGSVNVPKLEAAIPNTKKQLVVLKEIRDASRPPG